MENNGTVNNNSNSFWGFLDGASSTISKIGSSINEIYDGWTTTQAKREEMQAIERAQELQANQQLSVNNENLAKNINTQKLITLGGVAILSLIGIYGLSKILK